MRSRLLYPLTAAVLAAHAIALLSPDLPAWMRPRAAPAPEDLRFSTRSINPPAPAPAPAAAPVPRPVPAPRPKPPRPPQVPPPTEPQPATASPAPASAATIGPAIRKEPPGASLDDLLGGADAPADAATPPQGSAPAPEPDSAATEAPAPPPAPPAAESPGDAAPIGIGSAGYTGALPAAQVPPPLELKFEAKGSAKRFNYSASASLQWKTDGKQYQARQEVSAFLIGSRAQTSTGRIDLNGLVPQRFGDQARRERVAQFDAGPGRVAFSNGNPDSAVTPGVQDRLSIFIQLAAMFAAAPERYPPGTAISINIVSASRASVWTLVVDGPETLDLPAGRRETIRLTRQPQPGDDQKAQLWLAPDLHYLPVRIHLSQPDGDFADLSLQSVNKLP
ncbi:MAG: DUF3108 domain-containing protein [Comamonas sp.]